MELTARYVFPAPAARVWELLMDPQVIASCLPGSEQFESIGEDQYRVVLRAGVAAITGSFEGTVVIADKQPPVSYRLIVDARGRSGFVKGESMMKLADDPEGVAVEVAATCPRRRADRASRSTPAGRDRQDDDGPVLSLHAPKDVREKRHDSSAVNEAREDTARLQEPRGFFVARAADRRRAP